MNAVQLALELPTRYEVGESVWWTNGLTYLCSTYRRNGKMRDERVVPVTITEVQGDDQYSVRVPGYDHDINTVSRWITRCKEAPCEAVLDAYSKWGN